ncbi:hypothetical protein FNV43_RR26907 [Rhamnella rubrinervis]|uniref:Uncharacterized protein n=1 Tax=Rhamnella rubrinervis TaxID=2594499 RepID=A0A8K0DQ77_9ROSA|nr:hypothetical protein FNV43_RR26907 [Rhamnella rubrinervis]
MSDTCWETNGGDITTYALVGIRFELTLSSLSTWLATSECSSDMAGCWPKKGHHVSIPEAFSEVVVGTVDHARWTIEHPTSRCFPDCWVSLLRKWGLTSGWLHDPQLRQVAKNLQSQGISILRESSTCGGRCSTQRELDLGRKELRLNQGGVFLTRKDLQRRVLDLGGGRPRPGEEGPQSRKSSTWGGRTSTQGVLDLGRETSTCGGWSSTQGDFDLKRKVLDQGRLRPGEGELDLRRYVLAQGELDLGMKDFDLGRRRPEEVLDPGRHRPRDVGPLPRESLTLGGRYSTQGERLTWEGKVFDLGSTQYKEGRKVLDSGNTQPEEVVFDSGNTYPEEGNLNSGSTQPMESSIWGGKSSTQGTFNLRNTQPKVEGSRPREMSTWGGKSQLEVLDLRRKDLDPRKCQPGEDPQGSQSAYHHLGGVEGTIPSRRWSPPWQPTEEVRLVSLPILVLVSRESWVLFEGSSKQSSEIAGGRRDYFLGKRQDKDCRGQLSSGVRSLKGRRVGLPTSASSSSASKVFGVQRDL